MTKIKVIIPITSISVNTIQHHLPSSGRQKEIIMRSRKKGRNRHRLWCSPGILRYREYYITFVGICQP